MLAGFAITLGGVGGYCVPPIIGPAAVAVIALGVVLWLVGVVGMMKTLVGEAG